MTLSDIKNILETYKLYEFLFLIPILLFALWCGFIGFIRGVRKERFKAILGFTSLVLGFLIAGPITNLLLDFDLKPILESLNLTDLYDPQIFTGSVSMNGLIIYNVEKALEVQLEATSIQTLINIIAILVRFVVLIVLFIILLPIFNSFISFFRWLFFRDGIKKRKIKKENKKHKNDPEYKPQKFKKYRLRGWGIGFLYGFIIQTIVLLPLISVIGTLNTSLSEQIKNDPKIKETQASSSENEELLKEVNEILNNIDNSTFLKAINSIKIDDLVFDQVFYIKSDENKKEDVRTELLVVGEVLKYYVENEESFSDLSGLPLICKILSDEDFKNIMDDISKSELLTQVLDVAIHEAFKTSMVQESLIDFNIDYDTLIEAAQQIKFKEEIVALTKVLVGFGNLFENADFENLNFLTLNEEAFTEMMNGLVDSQIITKIVLPLGVDILQNQEFVNKLIEDGVISKDESDSIFNGINSSIFTTFSDIYSEITKLDLNSKTFKEDFTNLTDDQYLILNNIVDKLYENPLFSDLTTLAFKYVLNSVEDLKGIEYPEDINYKNDVKQVLELTKVIFRNENFELGKKIDVMELINSLSPNDIKQVKTSITSLSMLDVVSPKLGTMLQGMMGDSIILPSDINWTDELSSVFDTLALLKENNIELDFENPKAILTNLFTLEDEKIEDFGEAFGESELFIGLIKSILESTVEDDSMELDFDQITDWKKEMTNILLGVKPFGDFESIDFSDISALLSKIDPDKICKSELIVQLLSNIIKPMTEGEDKVFDINLESNQTYLEYMRIHIEDMLNACLILLKDDETNEYINFDTIEITKLMKKFYHNTSLEDPLYNRKEILKSDIIVDTLIYQLKKIENDILVIPENIEWKESTEDVGELNRLFDAMETLLPSGNIEDISNVDTVINKLYDDNSVDTILSSEVILESVKKIIIEESEKENPILFIPTIEKTGWKNEIKNLINSLEVITYDDETQTNSSFTNLDINKSIKKFKDKTTRKQLLSSLIISETIKENIVNLKDSSNNPILITNRVDNWSIELDFFFDGVFILLGEEANLNNLNIDIDVVLKERSQLLKSIIIESTMVDKIQNSTDIPSIVVPKTSDYSDYTGVSWNRIYTNIDVRDDFTKSEIDYLLDSLEILLTNDDNTLNSINDFDSDKVINKFKGENKAKLLKSDIIKATLISNITSNKIVKSDLFKANNADTLWNSWTIELDRIIDGIIVLLGDSKSISQMEVDINNLLDTETKNTILNSRVLEETLVSEVNNEVQPGGSLNSVVSIPKSTDYNNTAPEINWYRLYNESTNEVENYSEIDNLLEALNILLGSNESISDINISNLMETFNNETKQKTLLESIIISNTVINKIQNIDILRHSKLSTWQEWNDELPRFFPAILVFGNNLDTVSVELNVIINDRSVILHSTILEETLAEKFILEMPNTLVLPQGYSDYTWSNDKLYRTNKVSSTDYTPGELDKLFDVLHQLGTSDLNNINIDNVLAKENREVIFKSDIMSATFIHNIPSQTHSLGILDVQIFVKPKLSWTEYTINNGSGISELVAFLDAVDILIVEEELTFEKLSSISIFENFNGLNEDSKVIILKSQIFNQTLNQVSIS